MFEGGKEKISPNYKNVYNQEIFFNKHFIYLKINLNKVN